MGDYYSSPDDGDKCEEKLKVMDLTLKSMVTIISILKIYFILESEMKVDEYFRMLELDGVTHELSVISMKSPPMSKNTASSDLSVKIYKGTFLPTPSTHRKWIIH